MRKGFTVLLLLMFSIALTTAQQRMTLTIDEAIQIGLEKSKALHASSMRVQYADSKSSEASTLLLPSLKFNGSYTRLSDVPPGAFLLRANTFGHGFPPADVNSVLSPVVLDNYTMRLTVQQPLFTGFKLQRSADIAAFSAQATQKEYDRDRIDLVFNIKTSYWNLFKAIELQRVVNENVEQIKSHLKDVQSWQANGMTTTNDVLKVQVQLSDAQLRQIDTNNNVQLAMIALNSTLGLPLETEIELKSTAKHEARPFPDLKTMIQQAYERRPELQAMDYRVKAGDAAVSLAQSNWWPQVYLVGDYLSARPNQRIFPTKDEFKDTWDVNLSVSFDVWNWGSTIHQTDQAKAQLAQVQDGLAQLRDGVALDVTRSYLSLARDKERIAVAEQGVQQAEENYRTTNAKFKQGLATNTDLLDAEVAQLQAKTNYTQALVDFALSEANLEKSIGE